MADVTVPNGASQPPQTPKKSTFSLTEYASNPSPTTEDAKQKAVKAGVPEHFLLPNGYPDVSN